ncbi:hypothetical protein ACHWQZ_G011362 [Mnemiopsis leidyi]
MLAFGTFLLALSGIVAGEGHNSILNFPTASIANYIGFNPAWPSLNGLTVCGWIRKANSEPGRFWFSYALPSSQNEIVLGENLDGYLGFYLGGSNIKTTVKVTENKWAYLCVTWDSESGVFTISVNGELKETKENIQKGWNIGPNGNLVIGQEQDIVGGNFEVTQSFVGRLSNINVWDFALNSTEIAFIYDAGFCGNSTIAEDPILSYDDILSYDLRGAVSVFDKISCMDPEDSNGDSQVLRFPPQSKASLDNFLQFTPDFGTDEFLEFSICTWFLKTYADEDRYFFSYAQSGMDNSILLGERKTVHFWVSGSQLISDAILDQQRWYHLCFTWASDSTAVIYVDGEKVKEEELAKGSKKTSDGLINIGQEQDEVGGGYSIDQTFAGSLYNLNMFNIKLTDEQVRSVYANGTFCKKIPRELLEAGNVMLAYKDLYAVIPTGDVIFDDGEAAWRNGAMHCNKVDLDEDAHKPECWVMEERTQYKNKKNGNLGYIVGTVDEAKAACFATSACKALTCYQNGGVNRCDMRSSFEKSNTDNKKTSYSYRC